MRRVAAFARRRACAAICISPWRQRPLPFLHLPPPQPPPPPHTHTPPPPPPHPPHTPWKKGLGWVYQPCSTMRPSSGSRVPSTCGMHETLMPGRSRRLSRQSAAGSAGGAGAGATRGGLGGRRPRRAVGQRPTCRTPCGMRPSNTVSWPNSGGMSVSCRAHHSTSTAVDECVGSRLQRGSSLAGGSPGRLTPHQLRRFGAQPRLEGAPVVQHPRLQHPAAGRR
jgi:hypothetical protein